MGMTWLSYAGIDGGSKVDLMSTNITIDFNNLTDSPPIPGKDTTLTYGSRIHAVDYTGHQNPRYIIEGFMQSGLNTNGAPGSVAITPQRLGSFMMIGSPIWFYDDFFILNPIGSTAVFPVTFKAARNTKSKPDRMNYSLTLEETKEW